MAKRLKRLLLLVTLLSAWACSSIDCPVQNTVYTVYSVPDTLRDTLSVWTPRHDGSDTLLLSRAVRLTVFNLPISYAEPEDTLVFYITDSYGQATLDTMWIKKENIPHFESVDCSASFFHNITAVRHTGRGIDSIVINNPKVNYDPSREHFHLYLKDRR